MNSTLNNKLLALAVAGAGSLGLVAGCAGETDEPTNGNGGIDIEAGDVTKVEPGKEDSSAEAVFVDMNFKGTLLTNSTWNIEKTVETQLLYTVGQLNGDRGVSRIDHLNLENVDTSADGDLTRVDYEATLLVAWGKKDNVPSTYTFVLPEDVSYDGNNKFAETYGHDCVDYGAHDVDANSMWYYYRPDRYGCDFEETDIVKFEADVSLSPVNTTGKYPEYHKVWEDDVLKVVAVWGKYEHGATTSSDAGISAYNRFVQEMGRTLSQYDAETVPAEVPSSPGVETPEVSFRADLGGGKSIEVVAILVDGVRTAGADFNQRYEELSPDADLIAYNGHSGLGANIRALAQKGKWVTGQYVIVFMNGCDTYAYVDTALADAHAVINDDDDVGTKYVDLVMNALPSYFRSMPAATLAIIRGLLSHDDPKTYEQIFKDIDRSQVVLVSGEQDNEYVPGFDGDIDTPVAWAGMNESGSVEKNEEKRFSTPTLEAGTYYFEMTGHGDADLYVRIGQEPSVSSYDCRPYRASSNETCKIVIDTPAPVHVMVRGWANDSGFELGGFPFDD